MKIAIGNDHTAVELKKELMHYLEKKGHTIINTGTDSNESCNYAEYAEKVADLILSQQAEYGIAICGTGIGMSIAANKVKGIRACVCSEPLSAKFSKRHNDSNVIAFGARIVGLEMAKEIVDTWLSEEYEGGRHQARVDYLEKIEERHGSDL